ncbi:MAG TPA: TA system VapC family ribonuclease toxin [Jatrophihabitans sp.]
MIAVDSNVLVYAHRPDSVFHSQALAAVRSLAEGGSPWALLWPCLHEFYGVVTNPRLFAQPTPSAIALDQIAAWAESPSVRLLTESPLHLRTLSLLLDASKLAGPVVHDAKIAAICLDHGVRALLTMDRDFSRFPTLTTRSLLA